MEEMPEVSELQKLRNRITELEKKVKELEERIAPPGPSIEKLRVQINDAQKDTKNPERFEKLVTETI